MQKSPSQQSANGSVKSQNSDAPSGVNKDISILIVDDAKFSSTLIHRILSGAGYQDIRIASSAKEALQKLHERPATILMADWIMPELDGLELTQRVRDMDLERGNFTYVMLLTAKEGTEALEQAFTRGVDDFIGKADLKNQLLPRTLAATRVSLLQNAANSRQKALENKLVKLQKNSQWDPVTGVGTGQYLVERVHKAQSHLAHRGGAFSLVTLQLTNIKQINAQFGPSVCKELLKLVADRLQQLVRPLDIVARITESSFAILTEQPEKDLCSPTTFKRLMDDLENRQYLTSAGYVKVGCAGSMVPLEIDSQAPTILLRQGISLTNKSVETRRIEVPESLRARRISANGQVDETAGKGNGAGDSEAEESPEDTVQAAG